MSEPEFKREDDRWPYSCAMLRELIYRAGKS